MKSYDFEEEKPHIIKTGITWIANLMMVAVMALFMTELFCTQYHVTGSAMSETLKDQQTILIDKLTYQFASPSRYDIILFEGKDGTLNVKRIAGLPGETIQIKDGKIYADNQEIEWPDTENIAEGIAKDPVVLGEDEYFVLGDNPAFSEDSRFENTGNINRTSIIGKVWYSIYPLSDFGFVN